MGFNLLNKPGLMAKYTDWALPGCLPDRWSSSPFCPLHSIVFPPPYATLSKLSSECASRKCSKKDPSMSRKFFVRIS